ncbi:hypothetical protein ACTXJX_11735 [Glutamicibacter ardleyensis]|uniref:hypothetical protein n=1 Tax=Glutamicibacter ardleyensis TaxID=225894 RepID=UPI003FD4E17E
MAGKIKSYPRASAKDQRATARNTHDYGVAGPLYFQQTCACGWASARRDAVADVHLSPVMHSCSATVWWHG